MRCLHRQYRVGSRLVKPGTLKTMTCPDSEGCPDVPQALLCASHVVLPGKYLRILITDRVSGSAPYGILVPVIYKRERV